MFLFFLCSTYWLVVSCSLSPACLTCRYPNLEQHALCLHLSGLLESDCLRQDAISHYHHMHLVLYKPVLWMYPDCTVNTNNAGKVWYQLVRKEGPDTCAWQTNWLWRLLTWERASYILQCLLITYHLTWFINSRNGDDPLEISP